MHYTYVQQCAQQLHMYKTTIRKRYATETATISNLKWRHKHNGRPMKQHTQVITQKNIIKAKSGSIRM